MKITGNIGEWSELYVLLKLLAEGKLYAADKDLNKIPDFYSPLLRVFRHESDNEDLEYRRIEKKHTVELYINGDKIKSIKGDELAEAAESIYGGILDGPKNKKGAFPIDGSEDIMKMLRIDKIKAPSADKSDIKVQLHDIQTGHDNIVGFSIKSDLGNPPTLLNPSGHTNFVYEVHGVTDLQAEEINAISTNTKIRDRMEAVQKYGSLVFDRMESDTFKRNVAYIDTKMDNILGAVVKIQYTENIMNMSDIVTEIEEIDPLGFKNPGMYRYKVKKFLASVALGMVPSKKWDGRDEASGGYIIVKKDGDVVAYHLYNRDNFETYLLNNTRLDRSSITRYKYAEIYNEGDKKYIKLNLQIRFKG